MSETTSTIGGELLVCHSPYDRLCLKGRHWSVINDECRIVVLIVHGSGEHSLRYSHMAHFFNNNRCACVAFDIRGHGLSAGERGYTPNLGALLDDLECIVFRIRTELYPNVPLVIYAHGTGSAICLGHIIQRPLKPLDCQAIITSTPSLCLKRRPTSLLLLFARAFANLDPHFRLPVQGNYTNVYTNDPAVVEVYRKDALVHDRWPATTVTMFMELGVLFEKTIVQPRCPLLIQHGDSDTITPINGIQKWAARRVQGDVTFKVWPGHFHELHNDLGKEEIFTYLLNWMTHKLNI